jgi:hypothetical protein
MDAGAIDRPGGKTVAPVGTIGPQGIVQARGLEGRLDDIVGWGFQLVAANEGVLSSVAKDERSFLAEIGVSIAVMDGDAGEHSFRDVTGAYSNFLAQHRIAFVLIRPDFIVFGAGSSTDDLHRVIASLRGALGERQAKACAA